MLAENPALLWPSLTTVAALIMYFVVTINVGRARYKYQIKPPQMTGDPDFERVVRVQQNTLEQLLPFLAAMWLFALTVNPLWAAGLGGAWVLARILFAWGYYQAAEKRALGFGLGILVTITLLLGALIGIIMSLVKNLS